MASKNILIWPDISFEPGHWRPLMAMARKLISKGHNVKFLCTPDCEQIISGYEFEKELILEDLYPLGYSTLITKRPEEAHSRIEHCLRISGGCFQTIIDEFQPDLLIAGYFISLEALLVYHKHDLPFMITTTYLRHPDDDPYRSSLQYLLYVPQELRTRLMKESDDSSDYNGSIDSVKEFLEQLNQTYEMITCPRELDYDNFVHRDLTYYVEPSILIDQPISSDSESTSRLIYATCGSRVRDYIEGARTLFQNVEQMVNMPGMENYHATMAVGYYLEKFFSNSEKVIIDNWYSQTSVMAIASSVIIHGGLASIKESIFFGIPPVIVPMGKDQMDNAQRILSKNLGVSAALDTLSPERLKAAIVKSETDLLINETVQKMSAKFIEKENNPESVELIETFLGISSEITT